MEFIRIKETVRFHKSKSGNKSKTDHKLKQKPDRKLDEKLERKSEQKPERTAKHKHDILSAIRFLENLHSEIQLADSIDDIKQALILSKFSHAIAVIKTEVGTS